MSDKVIGFVGLGAMGSGMSKNILKATGSLLVSDLSRARKDELAEAGATIVDNKQIAEKCDIIFLSLPGPKQVREVVGADLVPNGKAGQWILDLSTVDSTTNLDMYEAAKAKGINYVDLPVSGGAHGAAAGTLSIMAGATEEELAEVMPYVRHIGKTFNFIGKRGGGSTMKLINNFMSSCHKFIAAEALVMADHLDVDLNTFLDVISNSSGMSRALTEKIPKIKSRNIEPGFTINLVLKDMELIMDMCREKGIPNYSASLALQWYRMAQARGYGLKDSSSIFRLMRELPKQDN